MSNNDIFQEVLAAGISEELLERFVTELTAQVFEAASLKLLLGAIFADDAERSALAIASEHLKSMATSARDKPFKFSEN
jgi:hypothetical protein